MDKLFNEFKKAGSDNCVTIILNTHRTTPDSEKDPLLLKNLVKEAENRLKDNKNKKDVETVVNNLHKLANSIDHRLNLDSLVLFVNENIARYVRLPIQVKDRVVVDKSFAIRDLVRALNEETSYYILVLSQQKVRLIKALNDKVIEEVEGVFPIENLQFYPASKSEQAIAKRQTNLIAEFFNRVDKELNKVRKENSLPVLLCSEEANCYEYLKICDDRDSIIDDFLSGNRLEMKSLNIVADAWKIMKEQVHTKNKEKKEELLRALNSGNSLADINEVWNAILAGKVKTMFIEQGLIQPAVIENDVITLVSEEEKNNSDTVIDDIYNEMIEQLKKQKGEIVFLPKGELKEFQGLAAIKKY